MEAAAALPRTAERESERNPEPQAVNYLVQLVQAGRGQGQEQPAAAGLLPACCPSACPAVPCSGKGS